MKKGLIFLLLGCFFASLAGCRKEDGSAGRSENFGNEPSGYYGSSVLPVHISEYDYLPFARTKTKSPRTFASQYRYEKESCLEIKDKTETIRQIPFKNNYLSHPAAAAKYFRYPAARDSVTRISSFRIIRENKKENSRAEYLVTMIPFYTASGDNRIPKDYIRISSFSGIILYSDLQGKLTGIRIRENGKMYKGKFIRNAEEENTVAELYYLSLYRSRSLATKGEDDDWELEIDELYVIGRRGEGEDPGRNPDDFDMPEDNEVHDDDSDNGGGGSEGEGGGNGGDYTEPEWTDPAYPNWKFDERSKKMIRPLIDTLAKDCAGKALLNSIKNMDITYKYLSGNYIISFIKNPKGNHSIKWFAYKINSYELLEELVHGLQILNGTHDRSHALNSEIEAKLAVYRYASKYNLVDSLPGTKNEWDKYAGKYLDSVCNENYEKLITFIRSQNYPKESFPEDSAWRHTNNIINLFDCYKPKPGL